MANEIKVSEKFVQMVTECNEWYRKQPVPEKEMLYTKEEIKQRRERLDNLMKVWNSEPKKK